MKTLLMTTALCGALLLAGCANPPAISSNPAVTATNDLQALNPASTTNAALQNSLVNAEWNLDQAIVVGALPATDPADGCMHSVLTQLGIEPAAPGSTAVPAKSFVPRVTNLVDAGSVAYIQIQQAKQLAGGGITVPPACEAVVGMFVIDAARVGVNLAPGGSVISSLAAKL